MEANKIHHAFINAFTGLKYFFTNERNGRIQLVMGLMTTLLGLTLHISKDEWMIVGLCMGAVLSAEMMNSALEKLCDHIHPSIHLEIRIVKDVAAGAVLLLSAVSAVIGTFIFLPKLWQLL